MSLNVKYSGYFNSNSGMAEAARNIVTAFHIAGAGITTEIVPNVNTTKNLGDSFELCHKLAGNDIPYDTKIIHITPDGVRNHMETMKKHIFHLFWETDKLPDWWVWELNHSVDEIWTGCEWNKKAFFDSGVKVPIKIIPQPVGEFDEEAKPFEIKNRPKFLFGSMFQWTERKNPKMLVKAFLKTFSGNPDVGLLIKTYKERFSSEETLSIIDQIRMWREESGVGPYPRILLYPDALSKNDIHRFYKTIDCFISTHRGEGWGLPIVEAMTAGLPVISTNLGGCHEHIPDEFFYPIDFVMCHVFNMNFVPWYGYDQMWASPLEWSVMLQLKKVYDDQEEAKSRGAKAKVFVNGYFNYRSVGKKMMELL